MGDLAEVGTEVESHAGDSAEPGVEFVTGVVPGEKIGDAVLKEIVEGLEAAGGAS